jgi:hypothetical protein
MGTDPFRSGCGILPQNPPSFLPAEAGALALFGFGK